MSRRQPIPANNSDGFTLVEMLVAISLLGLLSLGLAGAMGLGIRAWAVTGSIAETLDSTRATQTALRQVLTGIYPEWTGQNPSHVAFTGKPGEIEFTSHTPKALGHPGLARFTLAVVEDNGLNNLVLKVRTDNRRDAPGPISETTLLSGARAIEFSYFGEGETTSTIAWQQRWQTRSELPRLIRIQVVQDPAASVQWPELVVKPEINVDIGCEFDALTRGCRGR